MYGIYFRTKLHKIGVDKEVAFIEAESVKEALTVFNETEYAIKNEVIIDAVFEDVYLEEIR
jgi:hypothetical protein